MALAALTPMRPDLLERTRQALEPALRRVMHVYWRFARGLTLGVRALVVDGQGRIFLVKHSYVSGWHLPGGGVEATRPCSMRWPANFWRRGVSN